MQAPSCFQIAVGLFSYNEATFRTPGEWEEYRDLVAPGIQNVWICEVGSKAMNNSFEDFKARLKASTVIIPMMPNIGK